MSKPLYKRVLVKLSGEILNNPEKAGLVNAERLRLVAAQIQSLVELGVQVGWLSVVAISSAGRVRRKRTPLTV
jgi:uridylate kinase